MSNLNLNFEYVPLTFISSEEEIKNHIVNTIIFKYIYDNYKDTRKLGDLLENTQYGFTASAQDSGNVRLLRISDIRNNQVDWEKVPYCDCDNKNYLLKKHDILVARTGGTTGKSFYIEEIKEDSVFASYLIRLTANGKINPEYIILFLNCYIYWNQISTLKSGSAQPNVNAEKLKTLSIPYCEPYLQEKFIFLSKNIDSEFKEFQPLISKIKNALDSYDLVKEKNSLIEDNLKLIEDLRNSILNEAIQGKLVPQDPNDEPASELLKKIQIEKEKLIKEGEIKKEKSLSTISPNEIPYEIPKGWEWARLGSLLVKYGAGSTPLGGKKVYQNVGVIFLRSQNVWNDGLRLEDVALIDDNTHKKMSGTKVEANDILLNITGASIGRSAIFPSELKEANVSQHVAILRTVINSIVPFLHIVIVSQYFQKTIMEKQVGVSREGLSMLKLKDFIIPIPPLNEQKRIVAKVDKLMEYCDKIQENVINSKKENDNLLKSILKEQFN